METFAERWLWLQHRSFLAVWKLSTIDGSGFSTGVYKEGVIDQGEGWSLGTPKKRRPLKASLYSVKCCTAIKKKRFNSRTCCIDGGSGVYYQNLFITGSLRTYVMCAQNRPDSNIYWQFLKLSFNSASGHLINALQNHFAQLCQLAILPLQS